jgi:hypothetical protein
MPPDGALKLTLALLAGLNTSEDFTGKVVTTLLLFL